MKFYWQHELRFLGRTIEISIYFSSVRLKTANYRNFQACQFFTPGLPNAQVISNWRELKNERGSPGRLKLKRSHEILRFFGGREFNNEVQHLGKLEGRCSRHGLRGRPLQINWIARIVDKLTFDIDQLSGYILFKECLSRGS
jgi:hypothetical protein